MKQNQWRGGGRGEEEEKLSKSVRPSRNRSGAQQRESHREQEKEEGGSFASLCWIVAKYISPARWRSFCLFSSHILRSTRNLEEGSRGVGGDCGRQGPRIEYGIKVEQGEETEDDLPPRR